jgi:hypothetical protein
VVAWLIGVELDPSGDGQYRGRAGRWTRDVEVARAPTRAHARTGTHRTQQPAAAHADGARAPDGTAIPLGVRTWGHT